MPKVTDFFFREGTILGRRAVTPDLPRLVHGNLRYVCGCLRRRGHGDFGWVDKIPIFLRSHKEEVRTPKANGKKERLSVGGMLAQHGSGEVGDLSVAVKGVWTIRGLSGWRLLYVQRPKRFGCVGVNGVCCVSAFEKHLIDRPGATVLGLSHIVEDLTDILTEVTVVLKMLGQGDKR